MCEYHHIINPSYNITENHLPEGWELTYKEGTIILYSLDGSSLTNKTLFEYTGDLTIESAIVADWNDSRINVNYILLPKEYNLSNAYPNPFNPTTTLSFDLPEESEVSLSIYNIQGREVATLVNGNIEAGYHNVTWNANQYSSGIYFVQMITRDYIKTQKIMLVK